MENNKILDLLLDIKKDMEEMKSEQQNIKKEMNSIKKEINDGFDVVDIKLNAIETRVIKLDRKVESTTNQVARNMEVVEDIKLKLQ